MSNYLSYTNISSGYRFIKDGSAFNKYFPQPDKKDTIRIFDGDVDDTVDLMKRVVWKYIDDTKQIAPILKRTSVKETCRAIWDFVYTYIQYKFDKQGLEQLRRPARSWLERKIGLDCDCMSIFVSSVLTNLQIPHSFRITKYSKPSWQHVYVVVPDGKDEIIIDAVVSKFNYQKPYSAKKDYTMDLKGIDVAVLSGYEDDALSEALFGLASVDDEALGATDEQKMQAIYRHLLATRRAISQNPSFISQNENPQDFLKMLDYAIEYWNTDKREQALDILAKYEDKINLKNGFSGNDDLDGYDIDETSSLGAAKKNKKKGFFKKIGGAIAKAGKAVGKGVVTAGKVVGKGILKFNPLSVTARAGFLLTLRLNMKKMASKLKWGYATQQQAAKKGISAADWKRSVDALRKVEDMFTKKLQGSKNALKNAILKGKAGNLNGLIEYVEDYSEFSGLGIAPVAALAAAVPIVKIAIDIVKKAGLFKKGEDTNADNLTKELDNTANSAMRSIESEDSQMQQLPANYSPATTKSANLVPYSAQSPSLAPQYNSAETAQTGASGNGGIMNFIKANPMVALAGAGVAGLLIYQVLKPKTGVNGLNGLGAVRRKTVKRKAATKRKTAPKHRINKVKLF